jgi:hypothetical protein
MVRYEAPPVSSSGTVRYAPSFEMLLADIRIIGCVPRVIIDDESDFLILVSKTGQINYFNFDVVGSNADAQLRQRFGYNIQSQVPIPPFEKVNWHSFVLYPANLSGKPLFQSWNWFSWRGLLKNIGKHMGTDNPIWDNLTDELKTYLSLSV